MEPRTLAAHYYRTKGTRPTAHEYKAFTDWVLLHFSRISHRVVFTGLEVEPETFLGYHRCSNKLLISTAHNVHPHWLPSINARFRAVHDSHHLAAGAGFTLLGEIATYEYAKATAPQEIHWILFSEIVLQAAACIAAGGFARQKLVQV